MDKQYYQLVRKYGKYDFEYVIHEARIDGENNISISAIPVTLVGNTPMEIMDTLKHIAEDIKKHKPVDKDDCVILHDTLWNENEFFSEK